MKKTYQEIQDIYQKLTEEHSELGREIVKLNQKLSQWQDVRDQDGLNLHTVKLIERQIKRLCNKVAYFEGLRAMKQSEIDYYLGIDLAEEPLEVGQND